MKNARLSFRLLAGAGLLLAAAPGQAEPPAEQVELELPPGVSFMVNTVKAGPIAARDPFPLSFRHATLGRGRALRISLVVEKLEPPGARLSFRPTNPRSGICRAGQLVEGVEVPIFESSPSAVTGGCDLLWTLESPGKLLRAGSHKISLHWKLEAITVAPLPLLASGVARTIPSQAPGAPGAGAGAGAPVDLGERTDRRRAGRPEDRRRPPGRR
jgi:hypothetical protein